MAKYLLGLIIAILGIVVGWTTLGGNKGKITVPGLTNITTKPSSTPTPTRSLSDYRFTEVTVKVTPGPTGQFTKGGIADPTFTPVASVTPSPVPANNGMSVTVTHGDTGFTPNFLTVRTGTTVRFLNNSTTSMWVVSSPHPAHTALTGFDERQSVGKGGSYSYVFLKIGVWKYHNESNPDQTATVIVTQ